MADIDALEAFAADLIAGLEPAARQELARRLAGELRTRNQKRIAAQVAPDGTAYAPRKEQIRHRKGKIKRQMFSRLRTAKYLKAKGTPNEAVVAFTAEVSRIARVHHLGLRDRVNKKTGLEADYPARPLLGISPDDEALIMEICTAHLADRL
jgi:phage virion morphogenesis protein